NILSLESHGLEEAPHYGWPYCYGKQGTDSGYSSQKEFCQNTSRPAVFNLQAHSAPLGVALVPNTDQWPASLRNNLLIGYHGSWNRSVPTGYKIVALDISDTQATPINLVTGWLEENGQEWGRPVDVEFLPGGQLLISDDKAGIIYIMRKSES
ncbi:MAG: hypothetical protein NUV82_01600, partial [Candidatus Komeilibacteria bacterium]|nr:hypothetical protein [Candidatus Komeilibacteria bacterium]